MTDSSTDPASVDCRTCGKSEPPIAGRVMLREPLRSEVRAHVGAGCWAAWTAQQLRIINEYRLNLAEPRSREILESAARDFLKLAGAGGEAPMTGPDTARKLGNL